MLLNRLRLAPSDKREFQRCLSAWNDAYSHFGAGSPVPAAGEHRRQIRPSLRFGECIHYSFCALSIADGGFSFAGKIVRDLCRFLEVWMLITSEQFFTESFCVAHQIGYHGFVVPISARLEVESYTRSMKINTFLQRRGRNNDVN